jgi:DNA-binding CsgD family transcriptional regulator
VLTSYQELHAHRRTLLAQLRASMFELRSQREQSRRQRGGDGAGHVPADDASWRWQRFGFTRREIDVAVLLAQGCSNATVARRLDISPHTARHHTQHVLDKLGVHSRAEAGARLRQ